MPTAFEKTAGEEKTGYEEDVMKTTARTLIAMIASASSAFAASGAGADESGFFTPLFLAFGALIIAFQTVPALMLFGSMLKGLFTKGEAVKTH